MIKDWSLKERILNPRLHNRKGAPQCVIYVRSTGSAHTNALLCHDDIMIFATVMQLETYRVLQ
jgi:hypothetical protein